MKMMQRLQETQPGEGTARNLLFFVTDGGGGLIPKGATSPPTYIVQKRPHNMGCIKKGNRTLTCSHAIDIE